MNRKIILMSILCLLIGLVGFVEPALAGPGGKIARAMFETFWGKVVLGRERREVKK